MNIQTYILILVIGIPLMPFSYYLMGLKRRKKTSPVNYCAEANRKLEKSYLEQLLYP